MGSVALERDGIPVTGRGTQRRRLALLILLEAGRDRSLSRDRVLGYLWPEMDDAHARASLSQTLYWLRQELGQDVICGSVDDLRVEPATLASDRQDFEDAMAAEDFERAIAIYKGPFCDGFFVTGAAELERWVESERQRLAALFAKAARILAAQAAARGDHHSAVRHWTRLTVSEPLNSAFALNLMTELDAAGDRAAAVRHADSHTRLLRSELDLGPDPAVLELAQKLRAGPGTIAALPASGTHRVTSAIGVAPTEDAAPDGTESRTAPRSNSLPARRRTFPWRAGWLPFGIVALGIAFVAVTVGRGWDRSGVASSATSGIRVAVLPFAVHGSPQTAYLREGMVDLLSASLSGMGDYQSVDARALLAFLGRDTSIHSPQVRRDDVVKQFDATHYVTGEIVEYGDQLRIHATLYQPGRAAVRVADGQAEGPAVDLFRLVDQLTTQLLAPMARRPASRASRLAAMTTKSLPALRAYLLGERELRGANWSRATELFKQATVEDSTFALAHYRLGESLLHYPMDVEVKMRAGEDAVRYGARLPAAEVMLFAGFRALLQGEAERAERRFRDLVFAQPDNVEGWFQLGWTLYLYNHVRGRSTQEARSAFERALELDPEHSGALDGLGRVAWLNRDYQRAISLEDRTLVLARRFSSDPPVLGLGDEALRIFAVGSPADQDRLRNRLTGAPDETLTDIRSRLEEYTNNRIQGEWLARRVADSSHQPLARAWAYRSLAEHSLYWGKVREAMALLDTSGRYVPFQFTPVTRRAYYTLLPFVPSGRPELLAARGLLHRLEVPALQIDPTIDTMDLGFARDSSRAIIRHYLLGLLSARLDDAGAVARSLAALSTVRGPPAVAALAQELALGVRAEVARVGGQPAEALRLLEGLRAQFAQDLLAYSHYFSQEYSHYVRAELLFELGRYQEAVTWYASKVETYEHGRLYEAHSHLRRAQAYQHLGNRELAVRHYQAFVAIWRDCDPELRPLVLDAERALRQLESGIDRRAGSR